MNDGNGHDETLGQQGGNGSHSITEPVKQDKALIWDTNHALIMQAFVDVLTEKKRYPTQTEIAERCGLSRRTVNEHVNQPFFLDKVISPVKLGTETVMRGLFARAAKGYASEVALYMQLVHGWVPKKKVEHSGSLDFNNIDVTKLPTQAIERIRRGEAVEQVLKQHEN